MNNCLYCQFDKPFNQFTKNNIDFIDICDDCFDQSNILNDIFTNLNFDTYWEHHITKQKYFDNLLQLFNSIFEFILKKINIDKIVDTLLDWISSSSFQDFFNSLTEENIRACLNLIYQNLLTFPILNEQDLLDPETSQCWEEYINNLLKKLRNEDFKNLKIILEDKIVKDMLSKLIEGAISLVLNKYFGEYNNILSGISLKNIISSFLSNTTEMIINFIKSEQNQLNIKFFIFNTLKLLICSNLDNSTSLNRDINSESFLLLTKSITKTIQDKKLQKTFEKEISLILVSFKNENKNKTIDCILNSSLSNYNYDKLKNKFNLIIQKCLSSSFFRSSLLKNFIHDEIKSYFEYYTMNKYNNN